MSEDSNVDLHGEIKKLLPVIVTENNVAFAKAMAVFQRYEKTVSRVPTLTYKSTISCACTQPGTDGNHGELLKKIQKNFAAVFEKDFPFYVILAHRINR